jgi:hypothetical protein
MTKEQLLTKQEEHQRVLDRINAKFSRPGAWTIGKELGENGAFVALGIQKASISPRRDAKPS